MMEDYLQTEWPDLQGLADLDHRAVGDDRRAGPERARGARAPRRGQSTSRTPRSRTWRSREGTRRGVPCRLFRVSFTGELGFEVNVPADHGRAVWEAV